MSHHPHQLTERRAASAVAAERFAEALAGPPIRGALFSNCRQYRYRLWNIWDTSKPVVLYIMLNPSTADEVKNDPTVERCTRRAVQLGFGGVRIANIFALRSTDPKALYTHESPVDEGNPKNATINDLHIRVSVKGSNLVICGWGDHGRLGGRGQVVMRELRSMCRPHALKMNASGEPCHPLYLPYSNQPFEVPR